MDYWLGILGEQVDTIVEKAIASEGNSPGAQPAQASGQRWSKGISDPSLHLLWAAKTSRGVMEFRHRHQVDSTLGGISGTEANLVSTSTCTVPSLSDGLHHNGEDLCGAEISGLSMWRQSTDHQSDDDAQGAGGALAPLAEHWQRTSPRCALSRARTGDSACRTSSRCGKSACASSASPTSTGDAQGLQNTVSCSESKFIEL